MRCLSRLRIEVIFKDLKFLGRLRRNLAVVVHCNYAVILRLELHLQPELSLDLEGPCHLLSHKCNLLDHNFLAGRSIISLKISDDLLL